MFHSIDNNVYARKIRVLMYHRILPRGVRANGNELSLDKEMFRQQLALLNRWGYTTITFQDYHLILEGQLNFPRKPVILTFDDGYLDMFENAYPLLEEYGMRAVVFVLADRTITTNVWDPHCSTRRTPLMNGQQILELHEAGFEIASHGLTHQDISSLPADKAWEEISRSRMLLEILLNAPVYSFAYPFGFLDGRIKRMVKDAGYKFACGASSGPAVFGRDTYDIRRIKMRDGNGLPEFMYQMVGPYLRQRFLWWKVKQAISKYGAFSERNKKGDRSE
jgi:peptidoglycan/xylan/chitin deacetylase (PgdA/CDA1 family)